MKIDGLKWQPKLFAWKPDRKTGSYPIPRVIWNLAWFLPPYASRVLFRLCVSAQNVSSFTRAWEDSY